MSPLNVRIKVILMLLLANVFMIKVNLVSKGKTVNVRTKVISILLLADAFLIRVNLVSEGRFLHPQKKGASSGPVYSGSCSRSRPRPERRKR